MNGLIAYPLFLFAVYDLLTGKIVRKIKAHTGCVRDISWHPFDQTLITSSVSKIVLAREHFIHFERKKSRNCGELFFFFKIYICTQENIFHAYSGMVK